MKKIVIDQEFKELLPALDKETYERLEANLLENGCRDALVLWGDILIDGHNRYEICTKHEIPYKTVEKEFATREEALIWIISTQVSRRNLTPMQLSFYRGLHYHADKIIQGTKNQYSEQSEKPQNGVFQNSTAKRLSEKYQVSKNTITRDAKIAEAIDTIGRVSPEAKQKILAGEVAMNKKELEELSFRPADEIDAIAMQIEDGTYEKGQMGASGQQSGADLIVAELRRMNGAISKLWDKISSEIGAITAKGGGTEAKAELRAFLDRLEDLYRKM